MVDGGGVFSASPFCRGYAAAEGNSTGGAGSRRLTQTMTEGNVAGRPRSNRGKKHLVGGNHARSASSHRRYNAVGIVSR